MKSLSEQLAIVSWATPGPWTEKPIPPIDPKSNDLLLSMSPSVVVAATAPSKSNRIYANPSCGTFPAGDQRLIIAGRNDYPETLDWAKRARVRLTIFEAVCESMPEPKLGEWNWPQMKEEIRKLLDELPE